MKLRYKDQDGVQLMAGDRVKLTDPGMTSYGRIIFNRDFCCYMVLITHRQYPGRYELWEDLAGKTACWRVLETRKRTLFTRRLKGVTLMERAPAFLRAVAPAQGPTQMAPYPL